MTNLTISVDKEDLKQARIVALQHGTSLNAALRTFIKSYIGDTKRYQQASKNILQLAEKSTYCSADQKFKRDDLYVR